MTLNMDYRFLANSIKREKTREVDEDFKKFKFKLKFKFQRKITHTIQQYLCLCSPLIFPFVLLSTLHYIFLIHIYNVIYLYTVCVTLSVSVCVKMTK